jgi:hypothetical protein
VDGAFAPGLGLRVQTGCFESKPEFFEVMTFFFLLLKASRHARAARNGLIVI